MFAVFKTGGKQYKVAPGDLLHIEKIEGKSGDKVQFDEILMISDEGKLSVGSPLVDKAKISAELIDQLRGDKVIIFKKKRRQNYRRKKGHRQALTLIKITAIEGAGMKAEASKKATTKKTEAPAKKTSAKASEKKTVEKAAPAKKATADKKK